jgi:hypothetical protein
MGIRSKIFLLIITVYIICFSCKKSKTYLPPLNYVKNMAGMHYWHGTVIDTDFSVFPPQTVYLNIKDTFEIAVLNDSTIIFDDLYSILY